MGAGEVISFIFKIHLTLPGSLPANPPQGNQRSVAKDLLPPRCWAHLEAALTRPAHSLAPCQWGGASHLRRDYHLTEHPQEAGHKQMERDLKFFLDTRVWTVKMLLSALPTFNADRSGLILSACFPGLFAGRVLLLSRGFFGNLPSSGLHIE
jgi:hypothetical protein